MIKEEILKSLYFKEDILSIKKELIASRYFFPMSEDKKNQNEFLKQVFEYYISKKESYENLLTEMIIKRFKRKRNRFIKKLEEKFKREKENLD